jgi:GNAT superfamily N-acetyltransferase
MDCIRRARPGESGVLTELAMASKAHWGYSPAFLAACRGELTVEEGDLADAYVLERDGVPAAFYLVVADGPSYYLDFFYVHPSFIGGGLGRALFQHLIGLVESRGIVRFLLHADPNAEPFYLAMGATRIGEVDSQVASPETQNAKAAPRRRLPVLEWSLASRKPRPLP